MTSELLAGIFGFCGVAVGGVITWWLQKEQAISNLKIALEAVKTEHMAEKTATYYLEHKGYTDRSFTYLSKRLGGFKDDELRKILVRAGAVRYIRADSSEWWRLLSRSEEARKKVSTEELGPGNEDL